MSGRNSFLKSLSTAGSIVAVCLLMAPESAQARPGWPSSIPNSNGSCGICHLSAGGGGARNAFGNTVDDVGGPDWSQIYDVDSDGDGFTNGEELCDPMGTWSPGDADPVCDEITDPADSASKPTVMEMDMGMNMDMGSSVSDMEAPVEDMEAPVEDMEAPVDDMDAPVDDMDTPAVDMGSESPEDMGTGEVDMGASAGGEDMGASETPDTAQDDEESGCNQTGSGSLPGGFGLLTALGMLGFWRRRKSA